jgi:hypothetical protein
VRTFSILQRRATPVAIAPGSDLTKDFGDFRDKSFDIVDHLIGQGLHGFIAGPGNMRRNNQVWQVNVQKRTSLTRRLCAQYIDSGASQLTIPQGVDQSRVVNQSTPGGIDQQGIPLHRFPVQARQSNRASHRSAGNAG